MAFIQILLNKSYIRLVLQTMFCKPSRLAVKFKACTNQMCSKNKPINPKEQKDGNVTQKRDDTLFSLQQISICQLQATPFTSANIQLISQLISLINTQLQATSFSLQQISILGENEKRFQKLGTKLTPPSLLIKWSKETE